MGIVTLDLVGLAEIAELLEVPLETVHTWRHRGVMPEPFTLVSDRPAWLEQHILGWAESTGRLPDQRKRKPAPEVGTGSDGATSAG